MMCRGESQVLPAWEGGVNRKQAGAALRVVHCWEAPKAKDVVLEGQMRECLTLIHSFTHSHTPAGGRKGLGTPIPLGSVLPFLFCIQAV